MPTPSEPRQRGEWTAQTGTPRRSIFGNYRAGDPETPEVAGAESEMPGSNQTGSDRKAALEVAVARSFLYCFLAKAYEDPTSEGWRWLCDCGTRLSLESACRTVGISPLPATAVQADGFPAFLDAYLATFGHAARGRCPLNEIEYWDIKADPLYQPHRLADLAAFYRAFGLEVAQDAGERHDHLCLELEFMCVLSAKEAYALDHQLGSDQLPQCLDAQRKFLREHLGRWTPAFARRLAAATDEPALRGLAEFTLAIMTAECARLGVKPGSGDLSLRPVDEAAETLCESCGLANLPK